MTYNDKVAYVATALTKAAMETTIKLCGDKDGARCASLTLAATGLFLKSQLEIGSKLFGIDCDKAKAEVVKLLDDEGDER